MKIIKKNQFTILVIALMLVTAGYLNYNTNYEQNAIPTSSDSIGEYTEESNLIASIGDAVLVNSNEVENTQQEQNELQESTATIDNIVSNNIVTQTGADVTDEYFTASKLERDKMYSQMLETYQKILESSSITSEQKTISNQEITNINSTKNAIMISENLIKTKGFTDCVIFVNDKSISVIIKADTLDNEQIAQIQNIVAREMKAEIENIHISNK